MNEIKYLWLLNKEQRTDSNLPHLFEYGYFYNKDRFTKLFRLRFSKTLILVSSRV